MTGRLQDEIQQTRPFPNIESEAYLNLVRLVQQLSDRVNATLKGAKLSMPQYNVLRILRGAGAEGLPCGGIAGRMVHRVPDVTRLLDRLEARGLVARRRETGDRRVVRVFITASGLRLIAPLDTPLAALHVEMLGGLGERKLKQLIMLLEEARAGLK